MTDLPVDKTPSRASGGVFGSPARQNVPCLSNSITSVTYLFKYAMDFRAASAPTRCKLEPNFSSNSAYSPFLVTIVIGDSSCQGIVTVSRANFNSRR